MSADLRTCPNGCDLTGEPMKDEYFVHADDCPLPRGVDRCSCLPYGERALEDRFFSRLIGVEIRGVYDGIAYWRCPDCGLRWHRFPPPGRISEAVEAEWAREDAAS